MINYRHEDSDGFELNCLDMCKQKSKVDAYK